MPSGKIVSFHSPIELHIYDENGNHVGPNINGDIENEIPGVVYEVIENNKFAFLPDGLEYIVKGSAVDVGSFDARIQVIEDEEVVSTTLFTDMPLSITSHVQFDIGAAIPDVVHIDQENDGNFESSYVVSTTTVGILESSGKYEKKEDVAVAAQSPVGGASSRTIEDPVEVMLELPAQEVAAFPLAVANVSVESSDFEISDRGGHVTQEIDGGVSSETAGDEYENTAVVYKSFGHKIVSFFKSIWQWFISKL